jgi:hypothetical protein
MSLSPSRQILVPQLNLPTILKLPLGFLREAERSVLRAGGGQMNHFGGAQELLDRVKRAGGMGPLGGASMASPLGVTQAAGDSPLLTALTAWWELNEASGTRNDSHTNALHLTDNGNVGSAAGVGGVGIAASFSSINWLSHADHALLRLQTDAIGFTACGWMYWNSLPGYHTIISKDSGDGREYWIAYYTGFGGISIDVYRSNGVDQATPAGGDPSLNTWYFYAFWLDKSAGKAYCQINNTGTIHEVATISYNAGSITEFQMAARQYVGFTGCSNARMAKWGIWKGYVLSADERTFLYNSGAGRSYADL